VGEAEVTAFLNHLAAERHVAAATQNQALSALLFLYKEVLSRELGWLDALQRPTRPPRLPTVLTRSEVERLLAQLLGTRWLMASLLYGAGLRVIECLRLRVRCRFRISTDPCPRRQRGERPCHDAAGNCARAPARSPRAGAAAARA
jgi:site-specific recombinase XerD